MFHAEFVEGADQSTVKVHTGKREGAVLGERDKQCI
jgi:hypothetical protein